MHECVAEAFDTTFNVIILLLPVKALTAVSISSCRPDLERARMSHPDAQEVD
jgi:hypothetical protein